MSAPSEQVELPITGMSCAACASRIERRLNTLDGVHASVNYATERATVRFDPASVAPEALVGAVEAAGYGAILPSRTAAAAASDGGTARPLRRRLAVCAALTAPVLLMAMVAPLQFDGWQWVSLLLATPVALWGAWPFHRGAWAAARHGSATMDTLVSLGVLASWLWSV